MWLSFPHLCQTDFHCHPSTQTLFLVKFFWDPCPILSVGLWISCSLLMGQWESTTLILPSSVVCNLPFTLGFKDSSPGNFPVTLCSPFLDSDPALQTLRRLRSQSGTSSICTLCDLYLHWDLQMHPHLPTAAVSSQLPSGPAFPPSHPPLFLDTPAHKSTPSLEHP